jgi:hypothetical protein
MSLLERVEYRLGPINSWPSYIIRLLFVDIPTPTIVRNLTAFFVGNGVNVHIAADLYLLFTDHWHSCIRDDMYVINLVWKRRIHNIHLYEYYNVLQRKYLWLNGAFMDQNAEVHPVATCMEFGIDNTGYGHFINERLQYFRRDIKYECE